jgi:hypothetical protein
MSDSRGVFVVSLPFRVATCFLLLLFLWGFVEEEMSMSSPVSYDYEHVKRTVAVDVNASHGSYMPWKKNARDRQGDAAKIRFKKDPNTAQTRRRTLAVFQIAGPLTFYIDIESRIGA